MEFVIESLDKINEVAAAFIEKYGDKKVIAMYGNMGVGKTTFVKAICNYLNMEDDVNSPSFAIVNEYNSSEKTIYHFDFYRINDPEEAYDFGYEEYFYSGNMCFVEWPEKIDNLLPNDCLNLRIEEDKDGIRHIYIEE
ncbi:MAG: tRNA (adenosine(37)-N6)-threonylcarbamoyltransferase complex ATPase subunit type 1 TsaE [Marinifilaceae bacterium]|jgi:tRNA threonylcarbamoyladenosine biosynthesis protein TsaE|nr:tRNA (adenosine(37)-N6)-threonylcarbamoyltransferase complex ATPase subunit type 1 TsaE [Marinifilaceae bacterium]